MEGDGEARLNLEDLLDAVEAAPPVEAVDVVGAGLARMLGASEVSLLVTNLSGTAVMRMSHVRAGDGEALHDGANERIESLPLEGSVYHEALWSQQQVVDRREDGSWRVLVPVTERGDALGLLELFLQREPAGPTLRSLRAAAHALAYVVVTSRRHTDMFEVAQRDTPFSLAAEIQRRLLPPAYTVEAGAFTLAGWLEPAANVGGDTFDYSVDRESLYVSVTDAMGHSIDASLLATLTVGSLRNARRSGAGPADLADAANAALLVGANSEQFVTGLLMRIGLVDGMAEVVNAGHPRPYLLRDAEVTAVDLSGGTPFGISDRPYRAETLQLEPGDRFVIVTDGFLERNAVKLAVPEVLQRTRDRHPREVVRELAENVLAATGGRLQDDATVLCIDWLGADGERRALGGASIDRATKGT